MYQHKKDIYMKICIIGSGNVATHLAQALHNLHHTITGVYSPHIEHAKALAQKVNATMTTDSILLLPQADCYVFSVKDASLADVIKQFREAHPQTDALCIHTAGSMPLSVFNSIKHSAVLYPMQSFSKNKFVDISKVPLFIEGSCPTALHEVSVLAHQLSQSVTTLDSNKRKMLHLAAVFANNFTNHCCALAYKLLSDNNIDPHCLLPIIDETTNKLHSMMPLQAQTGPAVRWDENVINMQHQLLNGSDLQNIYDTMSQSIHRLHTLQKKEITKP